MIGRQTSAFKELQRQLGSSLGERLESTGFLSYDQIANRLVDASLGIVPYEKSLGTDCAFVAKIVESLGVGLPVVSTPLRGVKRYFEGEPAVVFARDFSGEALAEAVLAQLARPLEERRAAGRAASARVARELDWSVVCRKAVDFVEQVGRSRGRTET
jgi:glycosyltransferase involved in cell wall biosynthesis